MMSPWVQTLATSTALGVACALLSIVVVLRRWAFIGEGIAHSGFGGAGLAWLIMLLLPAGANVQWLPYASVVLFCLVTAIAIGGLSRQRSIHADAAIGIFLTASLAFGILAQQVYVKVRGIYPTLFEDLLFGHFVSATSQYTQAAVMVCLLVLVVVLALWKEIIAYSFDPLLAETSGVRAGFVHYLLMVLLGLVIVIGVRVAGSVLVTAMLVLPGTTALLLSQKLSNVMLIAIITGLVGTCGGVVVNAVWSFLPVGPMIVLILFLEFLVVYFAQRILAGRLNS
jgi:ABC-type Mn2+/Zn2+ transport system permease subunit